MHAKYALHHGATPPPTPTISLRSFLSSQRPHSWDSFGGCPGATELLCTHEEPDASGPTALTHARPPEPCSTSEWSR